MQFLYFYKRVIANETHRTQHNYIQLDYEQKDCNITIRNNYYPDLL